MVSGGSAAGVLLALAKFVLSGAIKELKDNTRAIADLKASTATEADLKLAASGISDVRQALALMTQRLGDVGEQVKELRGLQQQWMTMAADLQRHEALLVELPKLREYAAGLTAQVSELRGQLAELQRRYRAAG